MTLATMELYYDGLGLMASATHTAHLPEAATLPALGLALKTNTTGARYLDVDYVKIRLKGIR